MKGFLRRLRGIIGMGLLWAVGSVAFFLGLAALQGGGWGGWVGILYLIPMSAGFGFIAGCAFAGILSMTERHRRLEDLSLRRVALWGAIGGCLVTGAFNLVSSGTVFWESLLMMSLLTAGLSSGSVALAKRADRKLIEGDDEPLPALEGE